MHLRSWVVEGAAVPRPSHAGPTTQEIDCHILLFRDCCGHTAVIITCSETASRSVARTEYCRIHQAMQKKEQHMFGQEARRRSVR